MFLSGETGDCSKEFEMFVIMREMHWDYHTYLQQPDEFLILIKEFIRLINHKK